MYDKLNLGLHFIKKLQLQLWEPFQSIFSSDLTSHETDLELARFSQYICSPSLNLQRIFGGMKINICRNTKFSKFENCTIKNFHFMFQHI